MRNIYISFTLVSISVTDRRKHDRLRMSTTDLHSVNRHERRLRRLSRHRESAVFGKCQSDHKASLFFVYVRGIALRRRLARSSSRVSRWKRYCDSRQKLDRRVPDLTKPSTSDLLLAEQVGIRLPLSLSLAYKQAYKRVYRSFQRSLHRNCRRS